ncbi:hybrid sensor histidine kinase/response regulator transcription factor [Saccharicrinis sp. GN24d3]|uniref:hybrid sensor histidine kinase/response regulator transcription factor n=1 Tax=Saccharicrinis sp. GN24d3 TaxID=3458416 RepID=UPI0040354FAA
MKLRITFSAIFFLLVTFLKAQYYSVDVITTQEGLSQNDVTTIMQDSHGFMWFGTHDGINRFDGKTFKKYYKSKNGLASGIVTQIVEDKNKNLWIATMDNGISRLNLKTGKVEENLKKDNSSAALTENAVYDIISDSSGVVWYVTEHGPGKIEHIDGKTVVSDIEINTDRNFSATKFRIDESNRLWLLGHTFLGYIENDKLIALRDREHQNFMDIAEYSGTYLLASHKRIGQTKGKYILGVQKYHLDFWNTIIRRVIVDYEGNCWVGTQKGLYKFKYNNSQKQFVVDRRFAAEKRKLGLSNIDVRSLFVDKTGILYVGTYGDGVKKLNPKGEKFRHYLPHKDGVMNKIRCVFQASDSKIYLGDHKGTIFIWNKDWIQENNLLKDTFNINTSVICMAEITSVDGKRSVIAGGEYYKSLTIIAGNEIELPEIKSNVFTIIQDNNGLVWVGTYGGGLYRFDPSGKIPLKSFKLSENPKSISSNIIRSSCIDAEGRLWIGADNGLNVLTLKEQIKDEPSFIKIKHSPNDPKSISHNYILPIIKTRNDEIWIGTMGEGLNRLVKFDNQGNAEFERYNTKTGLINNLIRSVVEDDAGNLWISSNRGISKLNPATKEVKNYDVENGLQDYEFSDIAGIRLKDGMLLFGGVNGVNAFYPMEIKTDWTNAIPVFTRLMILNNEINVGDTVGNSVILKEDINVTNHINIKYKSNSFSVQFASLHYAEPGKNECKYMLEGFDTKWIEAKSGEQAKYTNLKPGDYTLKLMAANGDGVWSDEVKALNVTIQPPFLLTNFMFAVYAVAFIFLLLFFRKFSIIRIERKHELSIAELEKKKEKELNQMKIQFFMNISHEFKTPLSLIINPLEQLLSKENVPSGDKLKKYHGVMMRNAKLLLRLINQLMEFRKIELGMLKLNVREGAIKDFLTSVYDSFTPIAQQKDIKFNFIAHGTIEKLWVDYDKLEKVLYNVLSNAFKYTPEEGEINLELIDDASEYVTIIVSDNGEGIPQGAQQDVFNRYYRANSTKLASGTGIGLAYTKSLIELMKGKIEFKSKQNEGTVFFIKIPKNKNVFGKSSLISEDLIANDKLIPVTSDLLLEENTYGFNDNDKVHNDQLPSILIVEDNKDLCSVLSDALSNNYNVHVAYNGSEGIQKCHDISPDIIITDVSMPIMDGIEMTDKLKNSVETSHIPIVMLTAHATEEDHMKGLKVGADIYIHKPFNINLLGAQIVSLLKNRQALRNKFHNKINVQPSEISPTNKDEEFLNDLLKFIEDNISNPELTVQQMAQHCGFSQVKLNNKLDALTGQKAKKFIRSIRIKRACQLLLHGDLSVAEVTYDVGFNDLRYFRECFTAETGCLPSEYKNKHTSDKIT